MGRSPRARPQVLVATTVIEVGIDVPNATVMLVEDAERYGISQLHQLRGRIGRGEHASLCLLFGPRRSPRLRALRPALGRLRARRDRPATARRGGAAGHAPVRAAGSSSSPRCPTTRRCSSAPAARRGDRSTATRSSRARARAARRARSSAPMRAPIRAAAGEPSRRVRVIAGRLGGRRLQAPRGRAHAADLRARARGALLDARADVEAARVLDLFAGHRARSASRRSRAAPRAAMFVERDAGARWPRCGPTSRRCELDGAEAEVRRAEALAGAASARRAQRDIRSGLRRPALRQAPAAGRASCRARSRRCSRRRRASSSRATGARRCALRLALWRERRYGDTSTHNPPPRHDSRA